MGRIYARKNWGFSSTSLKLVTISQPAAWTLEPLSGRPACCWEEERRIWPRFKRTNVGKTEKKQDKAHRHMKCSIQRAQLLTVSNSAHGFTKLHLRSSSLQMKGMLCLAFNRWHVSTGDIDHHVLRFIRSVVLVEKGFVFFSPKWWENVSIEDSMRMKLYLVFGIEERVAESKAVMELL